MDNRQQKLLSQNAAEQLEKDEATLPESLTPVLTSRRHKRFENTRSRKQAEIIGAKVFLAAAIVWMAYIALRSFRRKPVPLAGPVDMESWVDGVWNENTDPPLAVIIPDPRTRERLRHYIKGSWKEVKAEKDPRKKQRLMLVFETAVEKLQTLVTEKEMQA